jgi:PBSX family phage terminase large subunit
MRKSNLEKLREAKRASFQRAEFSSYDDLIKLLVDGDRPIAERGVNPTQLAFMKSNARIKAYKGPAGCAKTSTGVADILLHALLEPGTKYLIARANYNDLLDTTMLRAEEMLSRLPQGTLVERDKSPPAKWWLKSAGEEFSQITFMGLTDSLGSYEFNGAFLDEADEMAEARVHEVNSRLRWKKGHKFIGLAFNPPATNHWLYTACTGKNEQDEEVKPPWMTLFEPVPTENTRNLPPDYYQTLTQSLPEDMRQRLVDGIWGSTFPGEPVVRQFSNQLHVVGDTPYKGGTLFRFWDFGYRRPCVLFAQVTKAGNVEVMREWLGHNVEGTSFIETVHAKTAEHYPTATQFMDYGDPAVAQHKDTGSMLNLLHQAGITLRFRDTPFDISMQLLRKRFETVIEKKQALLVNRSCRTLIGGLSGGYHFKSDGITPKKDGYYDHLIDALRYGVYNLFGTTGTTSLSIPRSIAYWSNETDANTLR